MELLCYTQCSIPYTQSINVGKKNFEPRVYALRPITSKNKLRENVGATLPVSNSTLQHSSREQQSRTYRKICLPGMFLVVIFTQAIFQSFTQRLAQHSDDSKQGHRLTANRRKWFN